MPEPPDFRYDVFLSHNAQDKPRVRRLAERLKAAGVQMEAGLRLWLDEWVIPKSDLHPSSFNLHPLRKVPLERSTAVHRDPANAGRRFIPLLLGDCALPDTLRRYTYVDFRNESEAAFAEVLTTGQAETGAMNLALRRPARHRGRLRGPCLAR